MKIRAITLCAAIGAAACAYGADIDPTTFSMQVSPAVQIPFGETAVSYTIGGLMTLSGEYAFTQSPRIFASAGLEYLLNPLVSGQSISSLAGGLGGGLYFDIVPRLALKAEASIGYNFSFLNGTGSYMGSGPTTGSSLYFSGGLGMSYIFTPALSFGVGVSYKNWLGLNSGISLYLGASYYFTGQANRLLIIEPPVQGRPEYLRDAKTPNPGQGIRMADIAIQPVFPVFHKYYDDHPIGTAVLTNQEKQPVTDITVSVYIRQYMDAPKESLSLNALDAGKTVKINLLGLFTEKVLDITEGTKVVAEITVEYRIKDEWYRETKLETARLYDRNAMSWDDDRRAAAFVTSKDPAVLSFAKNAVGAVRSEGQGTFDNVMKQGMAIHEALTSYGIHYVVDPKTPFTQFSAQKTSVDFLQFPRQTLEYKAGDCDDLSILYTALLESVGIRTAFITIPGHIYAAFCLDMTQEEAKKSFADTSDLIFFGGMAWIPVEVTDREGGFVRAWEKGAKQWRENTANKQANFYDMHESWQTFEPVGLPGGKEAVALPGLDQIGDSYKTEMSRFVLKELNPQVKKLEADIKKAGNNPANQNKLGVLYARFGFSDKAEAEFKAILAKQEYVPSLVNMGNLCYLREEWEKALGFYERAAKKAPTNATVQLCVANAYYQAGNYTLAKKTFDKAKGLDPALADKFAYLGTQSAQETRAGTAKGVVAWQD
jgi:tetratricopeptide (TPR) repeat protein